MKSRVLVELKKNMNEYVSGEALSDALGVSRTAVWKYIRELKEEGYVLESSSKKGYKLVRIPDVLNSMEIEYELDTRIIGREVHCFEVIDSTNNHAKKIAAEGCSDGTLVVAERQTAGKGRLGRQWNSSGGKGIWMSVVLKPDIAPSDVQIITLAASIAVVRAIDKVTGIRTGIKWPNDILLDGKKVCGILTEMSCEMEQVNYLVIGIGINVNHSQEDFSQEIRDTAISLQLYGNERDSKNSIEKKFNRSDIIKKILVELENQYDRILKGNLDSIIEEWTVYSVTLGNQVKVNIKGTELNGKATGITRDGKLIIRCEDGKEHEVYSGEVSVRGLLGYV